LWWIYQGKDETKLKPIKYTTWISETRRPWGGTVVPMDTAWSCQNSAQYDRLWQVSRFEMGFVFEVEARPKGVALALVMHYDGCMKGLWMYGMEGKSKLWFTNSKIKLANSLCSLETVCSNKALDRTKFNVWIQKTPPNSSLGLLNYD